MDESIAHTKNGDLRGERGPNISTFRGIPFAKPPVGPRRFLPPEPPEDWQGVRDALVFGPVAMQMPTVLELERGMSTWMSEDCLTLNVWSPDGATRSADSLPVLAWIHGGSFLNGSGSMPWFDGSALAARGDVIVVTINYRLGPFGYLELASLGGRPYEGSGNAGLLDQVAALVWIRDNIAAFGGDPSRVCVVGESAGAMSIGTLLATPAAEGLFQRAILQSGTPVAQPLEQARAIAAQVFDTLGVPADASGISSLVGLDSATILHASGEVTGRLIAAARTAKRSSFMWSPVVDGNVVLDDPMEAIASGVSKDVPVLIGTTADEMRIVRRLFPERPATERSQLDEQFREFFGSQHNEARAVYEGLHQGASFEDLLDAIASDRIFGIPTAEFIDGRVANGAPTWTYLFNWRSAAKGGLYGAAHTTEIPFVFDTFEAPGAADFLGRPRSETDALATRMRDAWVSFARDGIPSASGLPDWPARSGQTRLTMALDEECRVVDDPIVLVRPLWSSASGG